MTSRIANYLFAIQNMDWISDHSFDERTVFDHSNTKIFCYSDSHCNSQNLIQFFFSKTHLLGCLNRSSWDSFNKSTYVLLPLLNSSKNKHIYKLQIVKNNYFVLDFRGDFSPEDNFSQSSEEFSSEKDKKIIFNKSWTIL